MEFENQNIKCSIFLDTDVVIRKTVAKINEAQNIKEKQYYAQDILLEVESLLSCSNYKSRNPDCVSCHSISQRYIQEYKHLAKDELKEKQCH